MSHYLDYQFEDSPETVSAFDELPLWSAPFGLLLLNHLALRPGMQVVDAGCGAGFPLLELAERLGTSCRLYGIDPWKNAADRARQKVAAYGIANVEIIDGSAAAMPFADNSIDLVVSNLGINNFDDPDVVLAECLRVLRPGGRLALTTNLVGHWKEFYAIFSATLQQLGLPHLKQNLDDHQRHRGTLESLSDRFTANGFTRLQHAEEHFGMTFLDGTAFLHHHFIKLGWLSGWKALIPQEHQARVFSALEEGLNQHAAAEGALRLTVPALFLSGEKTAD